MPDEPLPVRRKIGLKRGDDWHKYAADAHRMIHRLHALYGLVRLNGTKSLTKPGVSTESAVNVRTLTALSVETPGFVSDFVPFSRTNPYNACNLWIILCASAAYLCQSSPRLRPIFRLTGNGSSGIANG